MDPSMRQGQLSAKDIERLREAGQHMTRSGFQGMLAGGALGWFASKSLQVSQNMHPSNAVLKRIPKITNNHVVILTLANAAMTSYLAVVHEATRRAMSLQDIRPQDGAVAEGTFVNDTALPGRLEPTDSVQDTPSRFPISEKEIDGGKYRRVVPVHDQTRRTLMKAGEDSHARRAEAIQAKKKEREEGGSSGSSTSVFKW